MRLATALIRGGVDSSSELSDAMVQQSGLIELQQFVRDQFHTRASTLKVRGVLLELDKLVRDRPRDAAAAIHAGIEQIEGSAHALRELSLLATARAEGLPLPEADAADAQVILGGKGTAAHLRLGLAEYADDETLRERVNEKLAHWRGLAESPLTDRATAGVCRVVIRSLDQIAADVAPLPSEVPVADDPLGPAPDVVLTGGPRDGLGEDAGEQGEQNETGLRRKKKFQRLAAITERHPFH